MPTTAWLQPRFLDLVIAQLHKLTLGWGLCRATPHPIMARGPLSFLCLPLLAFLRLREIGEEELMSNFIL